MHLVMKHVQSDELEMQLKAGEIVPCNREAQSTRKVLGLALESPVSGRNALHAGLVDSISFLLVDKIKAQLTAYGTWVQGTVRN